MVCANFLGIKEFSIKNPKNFKCRNLKLNLENSPYCMFEIMKHCTKHPVYYRLTITFPKYWY